MKICYVDESGNNPDCPFLVMVGILVDAARLRRTEIEFSDILFAVRQVLSLPIAELKGSRIHNGTGYWRQIDPKLRKDVLRQFCRWLTRRNHKLIVSAISGPELAKAAPMSPPIADRWLVAALHVALQLQKLNQTHQKNKGNTFLIFDENKKMTDKLADLLWEPPDWSDTYYSRKPKQVRLDQIVDTAFMVKSHHAGLIQVADLFAFILRRSLELEIGAAPEQWDGEKETIKELARILAPKIVQRSIRSPNKSSGACAKWYRAIQTDPLPNS